MTSFVIRFAIASIVYFLLGCLGLYTKKFCFEALSVLGIILIATYFLCSCLVLRGKKYDKYCILVKGICIFFLVICVSVANIDLFIKFLDIKFIQNLINSQGILSKVLIALLGCISSFNLGFMASYFQEEIEE